MSKSRRISASSLVVSVKSSSRHARGSRFGASRLPSRMSDIGSGGIETKSRRHRESVDPPCRNAVLFAQRVERLLEAAGVAFLCLRQGLEPVRDFVEAFVACRARHARIHVRIFVRFAGNGRFQVLVRRADGLAGGRIADLFEKFQMTVRMPGLALSRRTEYRGHVVVAFDIRLLREI